jgi:hypothetical protein
MPKKKTQRSKTTSKGLNPTYSNEHLRLFRRDRSFIDTYTNKINAWVKGKNVMITIENPNPNETNKKFIRVPLSQLIGLYKKPNVLTKGKPKGD